MRDPTHPVPRDQPPASAVREPGGPSFDLQIGVDHPLEKGSAVFVDKHRRHHFLNPHDEPMTFLWILLPGGLDRFFAEIGRPMKPGDPAPEPFPRPENIAEIEARTVFGWTDKSYDRKSEA